MSVRELFAYLRVRDAARAIEFYRQVFGATEKFRLAEPTGRIGHAELELGGTILMLSDEYPQAQCVGPQTIGGTSVTLHLHVDDADAVVEAALAAGGTLVHPLTDHFYGERSGTVRDPFGHEWNIGHELEALAPEEMQRRFTEMTSQSE